MRLSIGQKITLSFVVGILLIAGIGLIAYKDLGRIVVKLGFVENSDDLSNSILEDRRFEKNFLLYRDVDSSSSFLVEMDHTRELVSSLGSQAAVAEASEASLDSLLGFLESYGGSMKRVGELYREQDTIASQIVSLAPAAKEQLIATESPDVSRFVAELDRQSQRPGAFRDPDYAQRMYALAKSVRDLTAGTPASAVIDSYLSYFPRLLANFDETDATVTSVRETGRQMQDVSQSLSQEQRDGVQRILSGSKRTILYASLILLVVGVILARFVARRIAVPLTRLAEGTRKIATGEFTPIKGVKTHDEVGSLVESFNLMGVELKDKQEQLIQTKKMASLGTLTSGVAHELNNPLSNISTSAQILLEEIDDGGELEYHKKLLADIEGQTDRARRIVRNLLDFSREREPEYHVQQIGPIISSAFDLVANEVRLANIEHHLILPDGVPAVNADERQLQQVFINLIMNAVQAMPGGGQLKISAGVSGDGNSIEVRVTDTGHGIEPANLSRVFDPFFTTKEVGAGTGLGLSVSYGLVERHSGHISVESQPGSGSVFTVRLPAVVTGCKGDEE